MAAATLIAWLAVQSSSKARACVAVRRCTGDLLKVYASENQCW